MPNDVSVKRHRLKYKNRFVEVSVYVGDEGPVHISVSAPVTPPEKASFKRVTDMVNKLLFSNVTDRSSILGKVDRIPGVNYDVLVFMKKFLQTVEL